MDKQKQKVSVNFLPTQVRWLKNIDPPQQEERGRCQLWWGECRGAKHCNYTVYSFTLNLIYSVLQSETLYSQSAWCFKSFCVGLWTQKSSILCKSSTSNFFESIINQKSDKTFFLDLRQNVSMKRMGMFLTPIHSILQHYSVFRHAKELSIWWLLSVKSQNVFERCDLNYIVQRILFKFANFDSFVIIRLSVILCKDFFVKMNKLLYSCILEIGTFQKQWNSEFLAYKRYI